MMENDEQSDLWFHKWYTVEFFSKIKDSEHFPRNFLYSVSYNRYAKLSTFQNWDNKTDLDGYQTWTVANHF